MKKMNLISLYKVIVERLQCHTRFYGVFHPVHRIGLWIPNIVLLFILSGCSAGSGDGLDQNGQVQNDEDSGSVNETDEDGKVVATYEDIQRKVFTPSCATSGCHSGPSAPLGLRLDEGVAFDNLVNQLSVQQDQILRVSPGDPENSYLVQKIEGTAVSGSQMPRGRPALPVETIQAIRDWIEDGALGPRLFSIQRNIFTPICTACHFGSSPAGGLSLEASESHANLVGVQRPLGSEIRVIADDAESSFLIDKLEGNRLGNGRGDRMPLGGPFLDNSKIDVIRRWINEGAANNQGTSD